MLRPEYLPEMGLEDLFMMFDCFRQVYFVLLTYMTLPQISETYPKLDLDRVLLSGDIMTFDNWRLLHGRKSYVSRPDRLRHLEGAYLDWDEVMSRLRILRRAVHGDM